MVGIPGQPILTTQIYFESLPKDTAVKDSLVTKTVVNSNGTKIANFDFVVEDYREPPANTLNTNSTPEYQDRKQVRTKSTRLLIK